MNEQDRPGFIVGQYYKDLRAQGVGRHLAASLTIDYAKAIVLVLLKAAVNKGE